MLIKKLNINTAHFSLLRNHQPFLFGVAMFSSMESADISSFTTLAYAHKIAKSEEDWVLLEVVVVSSLTAVRDVCPPLFLPLAMHPVE